MALAGGFRVFCTVMAGVTHLRAIGRYYVFGEPKGTIGVGVMEAKIHRRFHLVTVHAFYLHFNKLLLHGDL